MTVSDRQAELAALRVAARAYLEWEAELSGLGIPVLTQLPARPEASARDGAAFHPRVPPTAERAPEPAAGVTPTPGVAMTPTGGQQAPPGPSMHVPDEPAASATPAAVPPRPAPLNEASVSPVVDEPGRPGVAAAGADKRTRLALLEEQVRGCTRCGLAQGRTQPVFSRGDPDARLLFVGEGPGFEEDRSGQPFVGPAGKLLDRMVAAMGFARDAVYVCNVVKCRPPGNRTPLPEEGRACASYLHGQLDAVQPAVIVALGRCATENLGLVGAGGSWRGRWGRFRGFDVMPTYHPAFLLRSPEFKRPVWEDLQQVMGRLKQPR